MLVGPHIERVISLLPCLELLTRQTLMLPNQAPALWYRMFRYAALDESILVQRLLTVP